jgi:hypothetical protein
MGLGRRNQNSSICPARHYTYYAHRSEARPLMVAVSMADKFRMWSCPEVKDTGAGLEGAVQTWYQHQGAQIAPVRHFMRTETRQIQQRYCSGCEYGTCEVTVQCWKQGIDPQQAEWKVVGLSHTPQKLRHRLAVDGTSSPLINAGSEKVFGRHAWYTSSSTRLKMCTRLACTLA